MCYANKHNPVPQVENGPLVSHKFLVESVTYTHIHIGHHDGYTVAMYAEENRNDWTKTIKAILLVYLIRHPIHLIRESLLKWSDI